MTQSGEAENSDINGNKKEKTLGGIKTMPFILVNEVCDRFAGTGFHANMITYLTQQLNLPMVKASNTLTNFSGISGIMPLVGALIADSFAGHFKTIVGGLFFYELVSLSVSLSTLNLNQKISRSRIKRTSENPDILFVSFDFYY